MGMGMRHDTTSQIVARADGVEARAAPHARERAPAAAASHPRAQLRAAVLAVGGVVVVALGAAREAGARVRRARLRRCRAARRLPEIRGGAVEAAAPTAMMP